MDNRFDDTTDAFWTIDTLKLNLPYLLERTLDWVTDEQPVEYGMFLQSVGSLPQLQYLILSVLNLIDLDEKDRVIRKR